MLKNFNFSFTRTFVLATLFTMPALWGSPASAQSSSDPFVRRATTHLDKIKNAKDIFSILHFGATMGESTVTSLHGVTDSTGAVVDGAFAIKVVYDWDTALGANITTATFFFDKNGFVSDITAKSTSILSPPFEFADGAIQALGELIIGVAKESGASPKDLADMRKMVDDANSKGLLMASMNVKLLAGN